MVPSDLGITAEPADRFRFVLADNGVSVLGFNASTYLGVLKMAYGLNAGAIIEVTLKGTVDGQTILSLFHYRLVGPTVADGRAFLSAFLGQIDSGFGLKEDYLACCSEAYLMNLITAQMIWAPPPAISRRPRVTLTVSNAGLVEVLAFPSSVSVALTKRTDVAGRKGVGTLHMPGVPNTFVEGSLVTSAGLTVYDDLCDVLDDPYVEGDNSLVPILFQKANPADSPAIISAATEPQSRTMRRRVVGRGI